METGRPMIKAHIADDPGDRRRDPRLVVELEARMRELGAERIEATVLDISQHGFMAQTGARFEVGSRIWLMLPGRERANAIVRWTAGEKLGAEFAEPVELGGLAD